MDWSDLSILTLLAVFTIRDIIAAFVNVPRNDKWYSKFIYGNYDVNLVAKILNDWGYSDRTIKEVNGSMINIAKQSKKIKIENYYERLILLLARYTMTFPSDINYSEDINSRYYVDTMEASTDSDDLKEMTELMVNLINKSKTSAPKVVVVPKGGNVELAQSVAMKYSAKLVVVKDKNDDSRATSINSSNPDCHKVNIEGSWELFENRKGHAILIDCNTSKGKQLINAVSEFNAAVSCGMKVQPITDVFVLYRVDDGNTQIDSMFKDEKCTLYRYFDLNEDYKEQLYNLNLKKIGKKTTIYSTEIREDIDAILQELKNKKMTHL